MADVAKKTLRQFLEEVGSYTYDHGDYGVVRNTKKDEEVENFVRSYLAGTEILKNGKDGTLVVVRGKAGEDKGATGNEELFFHGFQVYNLSGQIGDWVVLTFKTIEELEEHIISEAGYLNIYCTEMLVFENGEIKPFEVIFSGDNDITLVVDKERFDEPLDIKRMNEENRLSVNWDIPESNGETE